MPSKLHEVGPDPALHFERAEALLLYLFVSVRGASMASQTRNILLLLDGTSNEVESDLSNVLKFYRMAERSDDQLLFYHPGVGTMGLERSWGRIGQTLDTAWGLATGWRLDDNILAAYQFLCTNYRDGDQVYIFGFSRGAYTARALAGMISVIGLLRPEQVNLAPYALTAYKRAGIDSQLEIAWRFQRVTSGRRVAIRFLGLWDTVASVIVPRKDRLYIPSLEYLPYTQRNPAVRTVRHACAIDERRRMFRLYQWEEGQSFKPDPFGEVFGDQDHQAVWFAGDHSDIGGGYPETESQAAKFPLMWMTREAEAAGVRLYEPMVRHLGEGSELPGGRHIYVSADATAALHNSMKGFWPALEIIPKNARWRQWPRGVSRKGIYLPLSEPRLIPEGASLHRSVIERMEKTGYQLVNLPHQYEVAETREAARPVSLL